MRRLRVLPVVLVMATTTVFIGGAATPSSATTCSEPGNADCAIWEGVICRDGVPKAIRAAAGCFNIQP